MRHHVNKYDFLHDIHARNYISTCHLDSKANTALLITTLSFLAGMGCTFGSCVTLYLWSPL